MNIIVETLLPAQDRWAYPSEDIETQAITLTNLKYLTESDLADLFKNDTIGARAEFRHKLITWRKANDLQQVLNAHPTGEYVLRLGKLDDAGRKILIDATVSWFIKRKIKIFRNTFQSIAQDISNRLKDDKSIYYHKDPITLRPAGRLYDKYYNTLKRLKKSGELVDPESPTSETSPTGEHTFTFDDEKSAYDWLKLFVSPWSTFEANWKKTFKTRRQQILNSSGNTSANTLRNWKLFSHSCGYNLIDIDFNALHQNSSRLTENWQLKALLLHAVLRPNIKRKSDDKTVFRSTIKDSQLSFLLQVNTVNDVENKLDNLKTLQPLIIAIGSDLSDCKFYVYYDEIKIALSFGRLSKDIFIPLN
ncbi:uncharacterized protein [Eurosta solidaginis]|uniref:uncharacterized protein n=1 Tax=Eurosta solidaginis TaxID=178769 RepID=UPI003530AA98